MRGEIPARPGHSPSFLMIENIVR